MRACLTRRKNWIIFILTFHRDEVYFIIFKNLFGKFRNIYSFRHKWNGLAMYRYYIYLDDCIYIILTHVRGELTYTFKTVCCNILRMFLLIKLNIMIFMSFKSNMRTQCLKKHYIYNREVVMFCLEKCNNYNFLWKRNVSFVIDNVTLYI